MAAYQEYLSIIARYGIEGEFANVLAELLAFYSENYLADIASSFYNSSILKAVNEDSLMQLSLDHAVPIFRGYNPKVELFVKLADDAIVDFVYLQPLQEIFSYGSSFFYFDSEIPVAIRKGEYTRISIVYANKAKRVINYQNPKNEIFVLDDENIISEHLAFYLTKTRGDTNQIAYYQHTKYPYLFWGFINSEYTNSLTDNNQNTLNGLFHILVLTTPRWGIYVKLSKVFFSQIQQNNSFIRLEYLNYVPQINNLEHINKLVAHLRDKMNLLVDTTSMVVSGAIPPDSVEIIREKTQLSPKFNGIIRSITDYQALLYDMLKKYVIDAKIYHYLSPDSNSGFVNISYLILFIRSSLFTAIDVVSYFDEVVKQFFAKNLPRLPVTSSITNTGTYYFLEGGFTMIEALPVEIAVYYNVESNDKNIVHNLFLNYLNGFTGKLQEEIDPKAWLTFLSKMAQVEKVTAFSVWVNRPNSPPQNIYSLDYYNNPEDLKLIKTQKFFDDLNNNQFDPNFPYFEYINTIAVYNIFRDNLNELNAL